MLAGLFFRTDANRLWASPELTDGGLLA